MNATAFLRTAACIFLALYTAASQIVQFPYQENFDASSQAPAGWELIGLTISSTTPRSSPNCLSGTGNTQSRIARSPVLAFGERLPSVLTFFERRTSTAFRYRLRISFVDDSGSWDLEVAHFDTVAATSSYIQRTIQIPGDQFLGRTGVRLVLEILRDSLNTTGSLRIDDIVLTTAVSRDLGVNISSFPNNVSSRDSINILVRLFNNGRSESTSSTLKALTCGSFAPLVEKALLPILPGDTIIVPLAIPPLSPGTHCIAVIVGLEGDENSSNDSATFALTIGYTYNALVISEFMFAPIREEEPEWVEVFNPGPEQVDISNFTISDNSSSRIAITPQSFLVDSGQFVLISRTRDLPASYFPFSAPILLIAIPSLNNTTADAVVIRDGAGRTIDSVWYHPAWSLSGHSLERVDWMLPSISSANWSPSRDTAHATPGRTNSVQRMEIDVAAISAHGLPLVMERSPLYVVVRIRNIGRNDINNASIDILADTSGDSVYSADETFAQSQFIVIRSSDSMNITIPVSKIPSGKLACAAVVHAEGDERKWNDSTFFQVVSSFQAGDMIINEIMFDPTPGQSEWLELFNRGSVPVNISGWSLSDRPTASGSQVTSFVQEARILVEPGGFAVIASDSSLFEQYQWLTDTSTGVRVVIINRLSGLGLNADGDAVILKDITNTTMDSVAYTSDWHVKGIGTTQGRSLERTRLDIDENNARAWSSSPGPVGSSPGRVNVSHIDERTINSAINIEPNPFTPDGDGADDVAIIRYAIASPTVVVRAKIFDMYGRSVRTISDGLWTSGTDLIAWDGKNDNGRNMPIGAYILLFEASDPAGSATLREKKVIALAR